MHMVAFHQRDKIEQVVNRPGADTLMLTAYFEAKRLHEGAHGILYHDFLEFYTWQTDGKFRKPRERRTAGQVGRIILAHPAEGERYYLRILLNHVVGATSYEHLRTINGVIQPTFHEATEKNGLIEKDNTLDKCLTEATLFQMPSSLRRLFATILVFCESSNMFGLWPKHADVKGLGGIIHLQLPWNRWF
jgi:ATP-dependent DNA helicase PIF1